MPKELFLVRHAEADSTNFDIKDKERPLTVDGEIVASKLGKFLSQMVNVPDLIQCSTAVRTAQTTALLTEQLQYNQVDILPVEDLYEASARLLLRVINEIDDENEKVIIVGHNPSVPYLAEYVTGDLIGNVHPAGIVHLQFEGSWAEMSEKNAEFVKYYNPSLFN